MSEHTDPLNETALSQAGISGWPYGLADRVRFYELDALNHVNNSAYLRWFEVLRVRYFQDYGLSEYSHTERDPQLVVRHQTADFLAPMFLHPPYIVVGRTKLLKQSSLVLECAIYSNGQITARGETVMISLEQNGKTRRTHNPKARKKIIACDNPEQA